MELEIQESQNVVEKYSPLLEEKLNSLNDAIASCIQSRIEVQNKIEESKSRIKEIQASLDAISGDLDALEKGCGASNEKKLEEINKIGDRFKDVSDQFDDLRLKSEDVKRILSGSDASILDEQLNGIKRRMASLEKRISRKREFVEAAGKSLEEFLKELSAESEDLKRISLSVKTKIGFEVGPVEKLSARVRADLKELESKQVVLKTLSRRLASLLPELEENEGKDAEAQMEALLSQHGSLLEQYKKRQGFLEQALVFRRKFFESCEGVKGWAERLSAELEIEPITIPLLASDVERKMNDLKVNMQMQMGNR
jgi:chromosome segregation ATPase